MNTQIDSSPMAQNDVGKRAYSARTRRVGFNAFLAMTCNRKKYIH